MAPVAGGVPKVTDNIVFVTYKVTEPLLLSPFVFGSQEGKQGFYGIQTMNFQMNITSNPSRAWRSAKEDWTSAYVKRATVDSFSNSQLIFTFLTPHASDMLEPRNVVPYYELPLYRTVGNNTVAAREAAQWYPDATGKLVEPTWQTLQSSNIQLNCVPDKIIIFVRKQVANLTCMDTDSYLTIKQISINWNNQAGLLSSMSPEQLYRNCILSGLGNLTWDEFCGTSTTIQDNNNGFVGMGSKLISPTATTEGFRLQPTTGSILVLDFASVIQLTEEYYAPGSLGTFNLQFSLQVQNNHYESWPQNNYELIVMPMLSGVLVNERGTSSTFISLLTKADVIQASQQEPYTKFEIRRLIGGGFMDSIKSGLGWLSSKMPMVKNILSNIPHAYAQTGANVLGAMGYGKHEKGRLADRLM